MAAWTVLTYGSATAAAEWKNALKPTGPPAPALTLAADGKTDYSILLPAEPTSQDEKAAEELVLWLKEMTGAAFPVVRDGAGVRLAGPVISIGRTALMETADLTQAKAELDDEGYAVAVDDRNLFLFGGERRGGISAVLAFLEEDLGCRWYGVDANRIPRIDPLTVRPVPRTYRPALEVRDPFYTEALDTDFHLRNRCTRSIGIPEAWGGTIAGTPGVYFVHTFNSLVPPDQYFQEHPEYFSEHDGVRRPVQWCLTNPDLLQLVIQRVREELRRDPGGEVISVSHNDGKGYCQCDRCRAVNEAEGTEAGTTLSFVNAVAQAIEEEFPRARISTLAYLDTFTPPKTIRPRHNVVIQMCTDSHAWDHPFLPVTETEELQGAMKAWADVGAVMHIWDYTVNISHYLNPMPNMRVVEQNIRFYLEQGVRGVMLQGNGQGFGAARAPMRVWVWAKLLWDPSRDTRVLMRDFVFGYYAEAADPIWQYNEMLWRAWQEDPGDFQHKAAIRYRPDVAFLTRALIDRATELFDAAEALAVTDESRQRVQFARLPVMYVKLERNLTANSQELTDLVDRFEEVARRRGIRFLMEGPPDLDDRLRRWRIQAHIPPPEFPGSVVAEESQTDCNPNCGHQLVEDEQASAGYADRFGNDYVNSDFAVNWILPADIINSGIEYRLRVRVRIEKTGDDGLGFRAGVWDLSQPRERFAWEGRTVQNEPKLVLHKMWEAKEVSGDAYHWYDVGPFTPTQPPGADPGRLRVFIGGTSNPSGNIQGIFFDRAELIPVVQ